MAHIVVTRGETSLRKPFRRQRVLTRQKVIIIALWGDLLCGLSRCTTGPTGLVSVISPRRRRLDGGGTLARVEHPLKWFLCYVPDQ